MVAYVADTGKLSDGFAYIDIITVHSNDTFETDAVWEASNDE